MDGAALDGLAEIVRTDVTGAAAVATKTGQLVTIALRDDRVLVFEVVKACAARNAAAVVAALSQVGSTP